ncbi:MAG: hypothetical protein JWQ95_1920 [Sphaerisporangium sp.]|nr:hypothetical protein [Sphaerisporangium sp.]
MSWIGSALPDTTCVWKRCRGVLYVVACAWAAEAGASAWTPSFKHGRALTPCLDPNFILVCQYSDELCLKDIGHTHATGWAIGEE